MCVMKGMLLKKRNENKPGYYPAQITGCREQGYALSISSEISSIARAGSSALRIALPMTI